jgi:hypothetical protein
MAQEQLRPATTEEVIRAFAKKLGVPPDLAVAVAQQESGPDFDMNAVGTSGERGIFQLMPDTAKELGVDPTDFNQNITGGLTYLKKQLDANGGNVSRALMAYNGGPGNVARGTVSPAAQGYAESVLRNAQGIASKRPKQAAAPAPAAPAPAAPQQVAAGNPIRSGVQALMSPIKPFQQMMTKAAGAIDQRPSALPEDQSFQVPTNASGVGQMLKEVAMAPVRGYTEGVPLIADVLRSLYEQPAATAKGLAAGAVETIGSLTPMDVLTSGAAGGALKAAKGAKLPSFRRAAEAAPRPYDIGASMEGRGRLSNPHLEAARQRAQAPRPMDERPILGPVAEAPFQEAIPAEAGGMRSEMARLIRTDRPNVAPVVPGKPQYGTKEVPWSPPPWATAEGLVKSAPDEAATNTMKAALEVLQETDKNALVNRFDRKESGVKALEDVPMPKARTTQFEVPVVRGNTGKAAGRFNVVDQRDGKTRAIFTSRQKAEQWTAKNGGIIQPVNKSFYPQPADAPGFKPTELYKQGQPIPAPGGNLTAAEDSGKAAVRYKNQRERAVTQELERTRQQAEAEAIKVARQRTDQNRVVGAAGTRKMREAEDRSIANADIIEGSLPVDVERRMSGAAGYRPDVQPVTADPAVSRPPTGTIHTNSGAMARDVGSVESASINPALNPAAAAAIKAKPGSVTQVPGRGARTVEPGTAAGLPQPRLVKNSADQRKLDATRDVREGKVGNAPSPEVKQYPKLDSEAAATGSAPDAPAVQAAEERLLQAFREGRLAGITADDFATADAAKLQEMFDIEAKARGARQPKPPEAGVAEAAPVPVGPKHSVSEMAALSDQELAQRLQSENAEISQFAEIELERRNAAARTEAPAQTEQFSNAPRLVKAAEKPAPASGLTEADRAELGEIRKARDEALARGDTMEADAWNREYDRTFQATRNRPVAAAATPEPMDITPDPARPPDAPSIAMRPEETPQVQRLKLGESGPGPEYTKPRTTEPDPLKTRSREKVVTEIKPGKTLKETQAANVDTARVANDPTSLLKQMRAAAKTNVRSGVLTIAQKDFPKLRKKFSDNSFLFHKAPDFDKTGRVLVGIDAKDFNTIADREYPGGHAGYRGLDTAIAAIEKTPEKAGPILVKHRQDKAEAAIKEVGKDATPAEIDEAVAASFIEDRAYDPPQPVPAKLSFTAAEEILANKKASAWAEEELAKLKQESPLERRIAADEDDLSSFGKYEPLKREDPGFSLSEPEDRMGTTRGLAGVRKQEAWEAEIGPAPKGVEPQQWKTANAARKLAQSQVKRGVQDARVFRIMQDVFGAEETADMMGWGRKGAQRVREITQQSRKKPLSALAQEAEARMQHLIDDPSGFMRTEALIAGTGMAAGGMVGATIGGEDLTDHVAGLLAGAFAGAVAGTGVGRVAMQRGRIAKDMGKLKWGLKPLAKDVPRAMEAATTGNLLAGRAVFKASLGAMSSVGQAIYQRLREGRKADAVRMMKSVGTDMVPTYFSTLFEETRKLQQQAPQYSSHSGKVRPPSPTILSKGAEYATTQVLRPMIAADEAAKKVLRRGGFSDAEAARKMLVGEPASWMGQAAINVASAHFLTRMLVKFPRVGISALERAIEHTPYINRKFNTRSQKQGLSSMAPRNFRQQEALSPKALKAMGELGAASLVAGSIYGYYRDPGLAEIGLASSAFGGASVLAGAGMAAGKQFKKSMKKKGGAESAVESAIAGASAVASSAPKLDEDNVRMFAGQFVPGAATKRMLEDWGLKAPAKKSKTNRYARP